MSVKEKAPGYQPGLRHVNAMQSTSGFHPEPRKGRVP